MQLKYSTLIDRSAYDMEGLCDESLDVRINDHADLEEIGTLRAQEDWRKYVGPVENYKGGLGPTWNFMAMAIPECLPERLEIISYANEFAFLYDDITDSIGKEEGDALNDQMLEAFLEGANNGSITDSIGSGKKFLQAQMLLEMIAIDRPRALVAMKSWASFVELAAGRQHFTHFSSLEQYIPYRILDVGEMFWFGMVTFGMALTIAEEEMDLCRKLSRSAYIIFGLQNDLFSWEKELQASIELGQDHVVNAVFVLMEEHKISVEEAKELCKMKIKEHEADYIRTLRDVRQSTMLSPDMKTFVEALGYASTGNTLWSMTCPRYHAGINFNERQMSRMKNGVGKTPLTYKIANTFSMPSADQNTKLSSKRNAENLTSASAKTIHGIQKVKGINGVAHLKIWEGGQETEMEEPRPSLTPPLELQDLDTKAIMLNTELLELSHKVVLAPFHYLLSLPSKGVRDQATDALNVWVNTPAPFLESVKSLVNVTHSFSLMLDDLEDNSPLRRGYPSTHTIFGDAQTINSANFQIIEVIAQAQKLDDPRCMEIVIGELRSLVVGQSFDLFWTFNVQSPSIEDYLKMVDAKTGSLFRLIAKLMVLAPTSSLKVDLGTLMALFGRYFQIRDDYQNLVSDDYTRTKGFCEDLDEGKFSLPLIHALENGPENMALRSMLLQRRGAKKAAPGHKKLILEHLRHTKSLEYTLAVLKELHGEIMREVGVLETESGQQNPSLRLLLEMLHV